MRNINSLLMAFVYLNTEVNPKRIQFIHQFKNCDKSQQGIPDFKL